MDRMQAYVYRSESHDPWHNLAIEEYFQKSVPEQTIILYLWSNADTVVIGRTQNPWRECDLQFMERHGVVLSRRTTGGGAVYHDAANLNYSFIVSKELYDEDRQFGVILDAVKHFGLQGERGGRNDLTVDGRKFSGNAFSRVYLGALHHGTVLIDTNMEMMKGCLQVSAAKMKTHGVQSVSSRVVNLKELRPEISVQRMAEAISRSFEKAYGTALPMELSGAEREIREIERRNVSEDWLAGGFRTFTFQLENRFSWGEFQLNADVEDGKLTRIQVYSDSLAPEFILRIRDLLADRTANLAALSQEIQAFDWEPSHRAFAEEIAQWLAAES